MKITKLTIIVTAVMLLAACSSYKVEVDLTTEEIQKVKAEITSLKEEIRDFVTEDEGAIAWQAIIDLALAYQELGELGKAIRVYEDQINQGHKTKAILNNLGRLYEKTEQYGMAIAMYQRINDEYFDFDVYGG